MDRPTDSDKIDIEHSRLHGAVWSGEKVVNFEL